MSDEFNWDDDDQFNDDDILGGDDDHDTFSSSEPKEPPEEYDERVQQREEIRSRIGWKVPNYQEVVAELAEKEQDMPELKSKYAKLKSEGKEKSDEEKAVAKEIKHIAKLQHQVKVMEEHIEFILEDPTNFERILDYGSEVTKELGDLSEKIMKVQAASDHDFNVLKGTLANVKAVIEDDGVKGVLELVKDTASDLGGKAKDTGKEIAGVGTGIIKKSWKALFGGKRAEEEKEKERDVEMENALLNEIPEKLQTIKNAASTLEKLERNLISHAKQLKLLGNKSLEAVDALMLYTAAGDEILRIYDEEFLPKLIEANDKEQTASSDRQLTAFESARSDFFDKIIDLEMAMYRARRDVIKLSDQFENSKEQIKTVTKMRKNGVDQWKVTLVDTILQGKSVLMSRTLLEYSDIGRDLDDLSTSLQEAGMKSRKALDSATAKEIDTLLENNKRLAKVLEESTKQKVEKSQKQLEAREKLAEAEGELAALKDKNTKALADSREASRKALADHSNGSADSFNERATNANDNKADDSSTAADLVDSVRRKRKSAGPSKKSK